MMKENDRISLINYRIQQSIEMIELSQFLIDSNQLAVAVNRIYYGMFYALTALAIKHGYETSKHHQLIGWFNKKFISLNKIDKRFGKILRNAYQSRRKGDYDAFVEFTVEEVEAMLVDLRDFVKEIEKNL